MEEKAPATDTKHPAIMEATRDTTMGSPPLMDTEENIDWRRIKIIEKRGLCTVDMRLGEPVGPLGGGTDGRRLDTTRHSEYSSLQFVAIRQLKSLCCPV